MSRRQGVHIETVVDDEPVIMLRPLAMQRCVANIIDNAAVHGERVWMHAFVDDKRLKIVIDDDGPGIPVDQYESVFRPFVRLDEARSAASGSVGLGLPNAQDIVHGHGGKIELEKSPHGGLRVVIGLPL